MFARARALLIFSPFGRVYPELAEFYFHGFLLDGFDSYNQCVPGVHG